MLQGLRRLHQPTNPSASGGVHQLLRPVAQVRGPHYLSDKKKVEAAALEAELLSVDLVDVAPTFHIARHLPSALHCTAPFMFIMQARPPPS